MNLIELAQVEKRFGRVRALAGINLGFAAGTATHVAGPNGAGKSTLLRVIAGLTRPTRGSVRVFDTDLFRSSGAAQRGRVGYLGAADGLYGELDVRENLEFFARIHGANAAAIARAIDANGLAYHAERPVRTLSLGFRRRAGLARMQVAEPELWLLDEPWNGLDAEASESLAEALRAHRDRGCTALVAAHQGADHASLFDAAITLSAGLLVDAGAAP